MNERIDHCLYLAGLTASGCWEDLDTYTQEGIERFAELIVKECTNFLKDTMDDHFAAEQLEEHFGVEP
jgi:hypothetical protein